MRFPKVVFVVFTLLLTLEGCGPELGSRLGLPHDEDKQDAAFVKRMHGIELTVWHDETTPLAAGDTVRLSVRGGELVNVTVMGGPTTVVRQDFSMVTVRMVDVLAPTIHFAVKARLYGAGEDVREISFVLPGNDSSLSHVQ